MIQATKPANAIEVPASSIAISGRCTAAWTSSGSQNQIAVHSGAARPRRRSATSRPASANPSSSASRTSGASHSSAITIGPNICANAHGMRDCAIAYCT